MIRSVVLMLLVSPALAQLTPVKGVESQPLKAQVRRLAETLGVVGTPLSKAERTRLDEILDMPDGADATVAIQRLLAPRVLAAVHVNPESRVKVARGPAPARLMQQGWRTFLVRVHNEAGVTAKLRVSSPNARPLYHRSTGAPEPRRTIKPGDVGDRWLDVATFDARPMNERLSGLELEYRVVELYSRDAGRREARFMFDIGQGTQDLGFRAQVDILFDCRPAVAVVLEVKDHDGKDCMAGIEIRDARGRIYPAPSRRLAPDFFFHPQVYRTTGETVALPAGVYSLVIGRGPEYRVQRRQVTIPDGVRSHRIRIDLQRWIHPAESGWYSGDHHVHAGGCAHYESPTAGVTPQDMFRHQLGEDLNVACVLSWGPCWYYQKQFFEGRVHNLSKPRYQMRYDVEVSGFPSQHCGHLCLLRLKEDDYPGTTRIEQWPSWDLPILQWAKKQGGVVGFSHSGWGLAVGSEDLPNYEIPPFDGIGANEFIVDVTHDAVDFISTVDTPYLWELNIWYHTLNCGYRARISGETDFPCIYGERIGLGRVYCKLDGELEFDAFCEALKNGRSYVGDGLSHIMDFRVGDRGVGEQGGELHLERAARTTVKARVAALLAEKPREDIRKRQKWEKPYWHIERARTGQTRNVPLELIVNGEVVDQQPILADGTTREVTFEVQLERSSWVALRILPSSHTNPVFVIVGDKPIRASKKSAQWCLESVDQCWKSKVSRIREAERPAAEAAYEHARKAYKRILSESTK